MNKSLIIHAVWAVIAIIAFVVGAQRFSGEGSSTTEAHSGDRRGVRSMDRSGSHDGSSSSRRSSSRKKAGAGSIERGTAGRVNLSEKGIKSLGNILRTSNDPVERRIAFTKLLEALTAENAEVLREQIVHMSHDSAEWKDFHYAWGSMAGEVAVKFGQESEKRDMAVCFSGWASKDPHGALTWFQNLDDNQQQRKDLKWGAVYGLANADPALATNFVRGRQEMGDKDAGHMMNLVATAVLRTGNTVEAARWSASLPEGKLQNTAVNRVAREYAAANPVEAVSWLESLPQSVGKAWGLNSAFSSWASRDAEAAGKRLNQMAESPARDSAITGYTRRIVNNDPRSAIDWANSITNPKIRDDALVRSGRVYLKKDPAGAKQWLAGSHLSPGLQNRITGSKKNR